MKLFMTIGQAFREAIEAESATARFYLRLAGHTKDKRVRKFFLDMVAVEMRRHAEIQELAAPYLDGSRLDEEDSSYEFIKTAPGWADVEDITLREAFQIVLESQQRAATYYNGLAELYEGEEAAALRTIAVQERQCASMVEQALNAARPTAPDGPIQAAVQQVRRATWRGQAVRAA